MATGIGVNDAAPQNGLRAEFPETSRSAILPQFRLPHFSNRMLAARVRPRNGQTCAFDVQISTRIAAT
jgi:hypothetical protein